MGKLNLVMRQLTVRCLPKDLPDNIEIDITALKIGQSQELKIQIQKILNFHILIH